VAVRIHHGDHVAGTSSSSSPAFEVRGTTQSKVTIQVSAAQLRNLAVGMRASVVPDGASTPISGRVVALDTSGTTSSSGTVSYPVTIHLPAHADAVIAGADAAVTVVIAHVPDALTVPTSAVHYSGSTAYVEVQHGRRVERRTVTVKAVGPARTEIASGLTAGAHVVLARLNRAVPSSSTSLQQLDSGFGPANIVRIGGPGGSTTFTFGGPNGKGGG
jgi:HlyD family secretion protein